MNEEAADDPAEEPQSGPFCPHWSDGCDELCTCGHSCAEHNWASDRDCRACECEVFRGELG
jgi:hypothetical protein